MRPDRLPKPRAAVEKPMAEKVPAVHNIKSEQLSRVITAAQEKGMSLSPDGDWWATYHSHGGLILNGPDVWDQQQNGDTPGVELYFSEYSDGGSNEMLESQED